MMNNSEKLALIAGAANELGTSVATKLKDSGWRVIGIDAVAESKDLFDEFYSFDMTVRDKFVDVVEEIADTYGSIKALFCATGFERDRQSRGFLDTPITQWEKTLDGWLKSSINACFAVGKKMVSNKEGRIMIVSPDYSKAEGDKILMATGAGTLHGFAKSLGVELAKDNVLVNCVYANIPFDYDAIASTAHFLSESANYVSGQVISIRGIE
ncbi:MAG: SDR family oxidoreductase [Clostridiales bacterium]|nr:SDR family oxidoreductase [Clostridiales bacterium]